MGDGNQDANTGEASSTPLTSEGGDLISTVEFVKTGPDADPEGANNTGGDAEGASESQSGKGEGEGAGDKDKAGETGDEGDKLDRLDKHPRFQEVNQRMKTAEAEVARLQAENSRIQEDIDRRLSAIETGAKKTPAESGDKRSDITQMSREELEKMQDDDPAGFVNYVVSAAEQRAQSLISEALEERSYEDSIVNTYNAYAAKHPDFDEMWDRGELQAFIKKNPEHNAITAHQVLTARRDAEEASKQVDTVKEETAKEVEKRVMKDLRAKRQAGGLSGGPASSARTGGPLTQADLQNTKEHGGLTSVLARRSEERQRARYGG